MFAPNYKAIQKAKPALTVAALSGGKDSTALVLRLLEEGRQVDEIIFCDTGLEFPQMYDHLEKLERYIRAGRPTPAAGVRTVSRRMSSPSICGK